MELQSAAFGGLGFAGPNANAHSLDSEPLILKPAYAFLAVDGEASRMVFCWLLGKASYLQTFKPPQSL